MTSVYKSVRGEATIRKWCSDALTAGGLTATAAGPASLIMAGAGSPHVVLIPGTGFNGAAVLPWLRALSARWTTTVIDLPGQPGLGDPHRPRGDRSLWYGRVLDDVLAAAGLDGVVVVGNSLGAAVALASASPRIAARVLISPAGIMRLSVEPRLALASTLWLAHPTPATAGRMLRLFAGPAERPPAADVDWMALMAANCRSTLAPPPLPAAVLARRARQPCVVAVGEYDRFLPPRRLAPALRRTMGLDLQIIPGMGHLTTPAHLAAVVGLVATAGSARSR